MSDDPRDDSESDSPADDAPRSQPVRHGSVGARVPDHVRRGAFSTGVVVLQSSHEFVLDFLLRMTQPQQVSARVVLAPTVMPGFIRALSDNLANFERKFGPVKPPQLKPVPSTDEAPASNAADDSSSALGGQTTVDAGGATPISQPSAEDLYDELKLPDEMLAGVYANAVMISHTPTEFCFDFLTTFFPRSAVAARVFLAAPNVPSLLQSLRHSFGQYQQRQVPPSEGGNAGDATGGNGSGNE